MNPLIKVVKKALANKYGYRNVRVVNGTGTAWGWVEAKVTMPKPQGYDEQVMNLNRRSPLELQAEKEAEAIAYEAVKNAGLKFYTYADDGGYGDHDCFLLSVYFV